MNRHLEQAKTKIKESIIPAMKSLRWIDWAMIFFFASRFFTSIFTMTLGSLGIFLTMGILAILYLMSLIEAWKNKDRNLIYYFFFMIFSVTLLALFTMTFNPEAKEWMLRFDYGLLTRTFDPRKGIFAAFVMLLVRDRDKIFKNLEVSAWLSFIYLATHSILFLVLGTWEHYYVLEDTRSSAMNYNLSFGYEMSFVTIVFLGLAIHNNKRHFWTMGIIAGLISFIFGSRGVVLPIGGFIALYLLMKAWRNRSNWKFKKWHGILIAVILIGLVIVLVNIDLESITQWQSGGIRTGIRNIDMLLSSNFAFDSGRVRLTQAAATAISEKFPLGHGVFGDRPFLGTFNPWGYAHNVIVEMVVSFGIFGIALIVLLVYLTIKYLFVERYRKYSIIVLIFIAMCSKLIISDSFWYYDYFWALLGLYIIIELDIAKEKSEKKIKNIAIGKKTIKPITLLLSLVIIANIVTLGVVVSSSVEEQKNDTVRFNEPTVILAFQDMDEGSLALGINELDRRGIPSSVFVDTDLFSDTQIEQLSSHENVDIQLGLQNRPLDKENVEELTKYLDRSKETIQSIKDTHLAVSTLEDYIHPEILQFLRSETDALLLRTRPYGEYYYRSVTQNNMYKLVTLNASINDYSYNGRMNFIKNEHIAKSQENEALIIIYFRDMEFSHTFIQDPDAHTQFSYFVEIVDELQENDFNFITMSDLMEEAAISPENRTLKNLIMNSDIIQKVMSIIN